MITIQEFDAAYQRYYQVHNPHDKPSIAYPLKQFEDTLKLAEEGDPRYKDSHAFMFFYVVYNDTLENFSISVVKQIVSLDGQTSLPEFLNDYI